MSLFAKNLIIIGAGGHGRVIADAADASGAWDSIAFLDDRYPELTSSGVWPVIGNIDDAINFRQQFPNAVVGIGNNFVRLKLLNSLQKFEFSLPIILHPNSVISRHAKIAQGVVIFSQATVNIGTTIGFGCIINTGAKIDHDCILGAAVHISPGANVAGGVRIGNCSWIGIGASIKQLIVIGNDVTVGAGAAVVKNLPDGVTAIGVPARVVEN